MGPSDQKGPTEGRTPSSGGGEVCAYSQELLFSPWLR